MEVRPGDIGFAGKRKGFYPNAVRFFTKSKWSHCFVVTPPVLGEVSVIEADLMVVLRPFRSEYIVKDADYYEIWRLKGVTESEVFNACAKLYGQDGGKVYGFMQIPWFAIRAIFAKFGIRLSRNWSTAGEICSETLWGYLICFTKKFKKVFEQLGENETSPEDIYKIVVSRPDLFEFIGRRE